MWPQSFCARECEESNYKQTSSEAREREAKKSCLDLERVRECEENNYKCCDRLDFALFLLIFLDFLILFAFQWLCGSETWEDHVFLGFIVTCHPHHHPKIM